MHPVAPVHLSTRPSLSCATCACPAAAPDSSVYAPRIEEDACRGVDPCPRSLLVDDESDTDDEADVSLDTPTKALSIVTLKVNLPAPTSASNFSALSACSSFAVSLRLGCYQFIIRKLFFIYL